MQFQLLRHATHLLHWGGKSLLVDPMLSPAGTMAPVPGDPRFNPLVELPLPAADLLHPTGVLVTHTHRDHWDDTAAQVLPKTLPILCQPQDAAKLRDQGFLSIHPVETTCHWQGLTLTRTGGQHGTGPMAQQMGPVSGFLLEAPGEPRLYIAGDTIFCPQVQEAIETFRPDVIVLNAGCAQFPTGGPITMGAEDVAAVCRLAPQARIIAVHLEAFNHCGLSRQELRTYLARQGLAEQVAIPADGAIIHL